MSLRGSVRNKITDDWLQSFPSLAVYEPLHLLRRVGPLLQGIVLDRESSGTMYRPTFHVHCLLRESSSVSLTLAQPLLTRKTRAPDTVSAEHHEQRYLDAVARMTEQVPMPLSGDLKLADVMRVYRAHLDRPGVHYDAPLLQDMAAILAWAGREREANDAIAEATAAVSKWPPAVVASLGGVDKWTAVTRGMVRDRAAQQRFADSQCGALRASHLPMAAIIE